jgi:hypothetical protein
MLMWFNKTFISIFNINVGKPAMIYLTWIGIKTFNSNRLNTSVKISSVLLGCNTFFMLFSGKLLVAQTFTDSNLPIITINTNSQEIPYEPKIMADMNIYYHPNGSRNYLTDAPYYTGKIGIEIRGNSSAGFDKLSYGLETRNSDSTDLDTALFHMPSESDWVLYASHNDKTFMRNVLTYHLYNEMGRYASRTQYCEVVLNNQYHGIYVFMEKVKRDNNRVNIAKLQPYDTAGVELTGGYILRLDGYSWPTLSNSNTTDGTNYMEFSRYYPTTTDLAPQQFNYIQTYIQNFEQVLYGSNFADPTTGFRQYADEASFIDYLLLQEFAKNADIYVRSTFIVKPKDSDGKLQMGPPWDCDICYGNILWIGAQHTTGFYYDDTQLSRLSWEQRMMQDPIYADHAKCRWLELRQNQLSVSHIHQYIDSLAIVLNESQERNFIRWPVLNQNVFINVPPYPETYQEAVDSLKSYAARRLLWIDNNLPGACPNFGIDEVSGQYAQPVVFPNPSTADFYCVLTHGINEVAPMTLTDLTGKVVESFAAVQLNSGENILHIEPKNSYPPGVYLLSIVGKNKRYCVKIMR